MNIKNDHGFSDTLAKCDAKIELAMEKERKRDSLREIINVALNAITEAEKRAQDYSVSYKQKYELIESKRHLIKVMKRLEHETKTCTGLELADTSWIE